MSSHHRFPPKIEVRNLYKSFAGRSGTGFQEHLVLQNVNLALYKGESLVVIGGSGTGKSVLIKCILGLLEPDQGQILFDGVDITSFSPTEKQERLSKMGMLFQGSALFDSMKVWKNVAFSLLQRGDKKVAKDVAYEKLSAVNLGKEIAESYPAELSGGMQKRVALARAIAADPEVIFFDEPTTGLDPITARGIDRLIVKCVRKLGASALSITHDIASVRRIADRVALLHQGGILWTGTVAEMDETPHPAVQQFIHGLPKGPLTA